MVNILSYFLALKFLPFNSSKIIFILPDLLITFVDPQVLIMIIDSDSLLSVPNGLMLPFHKRDNNFTNYFILMCRVFNNRDCVGLLLFYLMSRLFYMYGLR